MGNGIWLYGQLQGYQGGQLQSGIKKGVTMMEELLRSGYSVTIKEEIVKITIAIFTSFIDYLICIFMWIDFRKIQIEITDLNVPILAFLYILNIVFILGFAFIASLMLSIAIKEISYLWKQKE